MRIVAVGRLKGPEAELFARYAARLNPRPAVLELSDASGGAALLAAVDPKEFLVALDGGGAAPDTAAFSELLARWRGAAKKLCFVLGGADGLNPAVLARAHAVLSLGRMTWPHGLARVLLVEQLYRVQSMAAGHPYHRAGGPG